MFKTRSGLLLLANFLVLGSALIAPAHGQTFTVPNALEFLEGDYNNSFPFGIGDLNYSQMRYQQVYNWQEFVGATGPLAITKIYFRLNGDEFIEPTETYPFNVTMPNFEIRMGSTTKTAANVSTTFAVNLLPAFTNNIVLVRPGNTAWNQVIDIASGGIGVPFGFDIEIELTTPYIYDPTALPHRNLLMEVKNFVGTVMPPLDAASSLTDGIGRVFATSANAVTGDKDTTGLVTQFFALDTTVVSGTIDRLYCDDEREPVNFDFISNDGTIFISQTVIPDAAGHYSIPNIPRKVYTVAIKGPKSLQKVLTNVNVTGLSTVIPLVVEMNGDADNDNLISVLDLDIFLQHFGTNIDNMPPDLGGLIYDVAADFTCDGNVDVLDFAVLIEFLGEQGEI